MVLVTQSLLHVTESKTYHWVTKQKMFTSTETCMVVWLPSLAIFSLCVSTSAIWHTESECFPVSSLVCITENNWPFCAKSRALTATNRLLSHCHHLSLSLPFLLCVWIKDNSHRGDPPKAVGSELRDRDVKEVEMTPRITTSIIEMLANLCKCPEKSSYLR